MANSNGNGIMVKALLTVLILALGAVGTLVTVGQSNTNDSLKVMKEDVAYVGQQVDGVETKQVAYDKQQARVAMTLYGIAKSLNVPSAIDTVAAKEVLGDSL